MKVQVVLATLIALALLAFESAVPVALAAEPGADTTGVGAARLGRLPDLEDFKISPAGKRIAFVRTEGDSRVVNLYDTTAHQVVYALRVSEQKLRGLLWIDDDYLFIETSTTAPAKGVLGGPSEWWMGQVIDARTRKAKMVEVHGDRMRTMNVIAGEPQVRTINGRLKLIVGGYYADGMHVRPALFAYDPDTATSAVLAKSDASRASWLLSDTGNVLASSEYYEDLRRWVLKVKKGDALLPVETQEISIELPRFVGLSNEPDVAVLNVPSDDGSHYRKLLLSDGSLGGSYVEADGLTHFLHARGSAQIIGGVSENTLKIRFFDADRQKSWEAIEQAYGGSHVSLADFTDDFRKLVVLVDGADLGYYYYELFDLELRRGIQLGNVYAGLNRIARAEDINYPAKDGRTIPAILDMLSRDTAPKQLPLIVFVHGGPASFVTSSFSWWRESLAEEGYAVLEPNFRGSSLNWDLESAGFGEFGRKMQTDLSDGVRYLVGRE